jgi:hypothetical protein
MNAMRLPLFALAVALAGAGCPKQGETGETVPNAGTTDDSADERATVEAGDGTAAPSAPRARAGGVWGPLGDLAPAASGSTVGLVEPPYPAPDLPPPEPFELERVQVAVEVAQLVGSPVWALVRQLVSQEFGSEARCALALFEESQAVYVDVAFDERGEALDVLLSVRTGTGTAEVLSCFRDAFNGGTAFVEVPVGDRTGWADPGAGPEGGVMVEAEPGWWLLALPARAERELLSGRRPEDDLVFAELTGPLGSFAVRLAAVPRPGLATTPFGSPAAGEREACLAEIWPSVTGLAAGLSLTGTVDGGVALRTGSPEAASEVRACVASFWNRTAHDVTEELSPEQLATAQQLLGMPLEEAMRSARFEVVSNFATAHASFPLGALLGILQGAF